MTQFHTIICRLAVILALFIPLFFASAAFGSKFGIWNWQTGLGLVRGDFAKCLLIGTAAVAALSLVLSVAIQPRQYILASLFGLFIPLAGINYGRVVTKTAKTLPAIHDITTDTVDVPGFSQAIIDLRKDATNGLDYATELAPRSKKTLPEAQAKSYPDIETIKTSLSPNAAYKKALFVVRAMGWDVVTHDQDASRVEATAKTFWFGFKDDVVIRIRPAQDGSLVDMRSVSRVGVSDLGMNAQRIRKFTAAFNTP